MTADMLEKIVIGTLKFTSATEASSIAQLVVRPNHMPAVTSSNPARVAFAPLVHSSNGWSDTSEYYNFLPQLFAHPLHHSLLPFKNTFQTPIFETPLKHLQNTYLSNTLRTLFVTTREVTSQCLGKGVLHYQHNQLATLSPRSKSY